MNFSATLSVNVVYRFETFAYPQTWNNSFPGVYILFIVIWTWLFFHYKSALIRGEVDQKGILQTNMQQSKRYIYLTMIPQTISIHY